MNMNSETRIKLRNMRALAGDGAAYNGYIFKSPIIVSIALFYALTAWVFITSDLSDSQTGTMAASQSNVVNQVFWVLLSALSGVSIAYSGKSTRLKLTPGVLAIATYIILALTSALWSNSFDITIRRGLQQCLVLFIFFLTPALSRNTDDFLEGIYINLGLVIILNTVAALFIKPGPIGYSGIYPQKNILGALAGITFVFCGTRVLCNKTERNLKSLAVVFLSGILLVYSQSKTSLGLGILCPTISLLSVSVGKLLRVTFSAALALISLSLFLLSIIIANLMNINSEMVSLFLFADTTFTGRTAIWDFALHYAEQRPIFGWGYQAFWGAGVDSPNLKLTTFISGLLQSHNGYIDVLVELGWLGFVTMCLFILFTIVSIGRKWAYQTSRLITVASTFLFCSAHNLLESSLGRGYSAQWVVMLVLAGCSVGSSRGDRRTRDVQP